jgi:hypothetical protein
MVMYIQYIGESKAKSYKYIYNHGHLNYFFTLKVPKCEIFDDSDFIIITPQSPSGLATLGLKYKLVIFIFLVVSS